MKVNKVLLLKVLGSSFNHNNSLLEAFNYLNRFNLINNNDLEKITAILKEEGSFENILEYLKIKKEIIEFIMFFNNYYPLSESIDISIKLIEERDNLKKDFITSLIYPSILIILSTIAIYFVSNSIVPQLFLLNENNDATYDIIVKILTYAPSIAMLIAFILIIVIIAIILLLKKDFEKYMPMLIKIKLIKKGIQLFSSITFALYFKEVIRNITLSKQSFEILQTQSNNIFIQYLTKYYLAQLKKGEHIFDLISNTEYLSNDLKHTILIAKDSKNMANLLDDYYQVKMAILKRNTKSFIAIFVPVVISIVGLFLILMYLLIMLPIINMSTSI